MKKLFLAGLTAMIALSLIACKKDENKDEPTTPKTKTELLTQAKGWELIEATCTPEYELESGAIITNLFDGYFWDCELDDIMFFMVNKSQILKYGKDLCDEQEGTEESLGNWTLVDDTHLKMYLPAYPEELEAIILKLDAETLKVQVLDINEPDENPTKLARNAKDRVFTFTLTYKIAK